MLPPQSLFTPVLSHELTLSTREFSSEFFWLAGRLAEMKEGKTVSCTYVCTDMCKLGNSLFSTKAISVMLMFMQLHKYT